MSVFDNMAFISSGDPDKDRREAQEIVLHESRMAEGMCPNGCGPMRTVDAHSRECPACGFTCWSNVPIAACLPGEEPDENPKGEWDICTECGAWAYHDFVTGYWEARRQEMDDTLACQTCGG